MDYLKEYARYLKMRNDSPYPLIELKKKAYQALEPIPSQAPVAKTAAVQDGIDLALSLIQEFNHPKITEFAKKLHENLEELEAFLAREERRVAPWGQEMEAGQEGGVVWEWQNRGILNLEIPLALQGIKVFFEALSLFHCFFILAESMQGFRPPLQIHRGRPAWLLPLLQLFFGVNRMPWEGMIIVSATWEAPVDRLSYVTWLICAREEVKGFLKKLWLLLDSRVRAQTLRCNAHFYGCCKFPKIAPMTGVLSCFDPIFGNPKTQHEPKLFCGRNDNQCLPWENEPYRVQQVNWMQKLPPGSVGNSPACAKEEGQFPALLGIHLQEGG